MHLLVLLALVEYLSRGDSNTGDRATGRERLTHLVDDDELSLDLENLRGSLLLNATASSSTTSNHDGVLVDAEEELLSLLRALDLPFSPASPKLNPKTWVQTHCNAAFHDRMLEFAESYAAITSAERAIKIQSHSPEDLRRALVRSAQSSHHCEDRPNASHCRGDFHA